MRKLNIILFAYLFWVSCSTAPPMDVNTPTKSTHPEQNSPTLFSRGLMTEYDVWDFLTEKPTEQAVLSTLGLPDSVWVDDNLEFKMLYYYIPEIRDYNSVEINLKSGTAAGFEWD